MARSLLGNTFLPKNGSLNEWKLLQNRGKGKEIIKQTPILSQQDGEMHLCISEAVAVLPFSSSLTLKRKLFWSLSQGGWVSLAPPIHGNHNLPHAPLMKKQQICYDLVNSCRDSEPPFWRQFWKIPIWTPWLLREQTRILEDYL